MLRTKQTMIMHNPASAFFRKEVEITYITTFADGSTPVVSWTIDSPAGATGGTCQPRDLRHPFELHNLDKYINGDFEDVDNIPGFQHMDRFLAPIMDGWGACEADAPEADDPKAYIDWIDQCEAHCGVSDCLIDAQPSELLILFRLATEVYHSDTK